MPLSQVQSLQIRKRGYFSLLRYPLSCWSSGNHSSFLGSWHALHKVLNIVLKIGKKQTPSELGLRFLTVMLINLYPAIDSKNLPVDEVVLLQKTVRNPRRQ